MITCAKDCGVYLSTHRPSKALDLAAFPFPIPSLGKPTRDDLLGTDADADAGSKLAMLLAMAKARICIVSASFISSLIGLDRRCLLVD